MLTVRSLVMNKDIYTVGWGGGCGGCSVAVWQCIACISATLFVDFTARKAQRAGPDVVAATAAQLPSYSMYTVLHFTILILHCFFTTLILHCFFESQL